MYVSAHDPRGSASDSLMTQIDVDNVMQAYRLFDQQVASMQRAIQRSSLLRDIPTCGEDVISVDARTVFQPKIDHILDTHAAHLEELREARDRLKEAATQYGLTDEVAAADFGSTHIPSASPGSAVER